MASKLATLVQDTTTVAELSLALTSLKLATKPDNAAEMTTDGVLTALLTLLRDNKTITQVEQGTSVSVFERGAILLAELVAAPGMIDDFTLLHHFIFLHP